MKKVSILILMIVSLILFGCLANDSGVETNTNPSLTSTEVSTSDIPIITAESTLPVGKTQVPAATTNPTQVLFVVKQLLSHNDYCITPCIWGIIPGRTTLKESQDIFAYLGSPLVQTLQSDNQSFYESSFGPNDGLENGLLFQVILTVQDNNIKNLRAGVNLINYKGPSTHNEWAAYSPENVLKRYGVPSRIGFSLSYPAESGFPPNAVWYDMTMYFDSLDLIFEYSSHPLKSLTKVGNAVHICPITDQFESVGIWLGKEPVYPPIMGLPLERASSFTLDDFFDTLVVDRGCLDLNSKAFIP